MRDPAPKKKFTGTGILRGLIPLHTLGKDRFGETTGSLGIEDISTGSYLFGEGDRDNHSSYLLDGVISCIDASGRVTGMPSAEDRKLHPDASGGHEPGRCCPLDMFGVGHRFPVKNQNHGQARV